MVTKAHTLGLEMSNPMRDILWRMVLKHVCDPLLLLMLGSRKKIQTLEKNNVMYILKSVFLFKYKLTLNYCVNHSVGLTTGSLISDWDI